MPYLPVNIFVLNRSGANAPIQGVLVRLLDRQGRTINTQAVTDDEGKAEFLLPTEQSPYQVRCYRQGVAFDRPVEIQLSTTLVNNFNIYGDALTPPLSKDPRVCVAYGYFKDGTNSPFAGCTLHFMPKFEPLLLDGSAVLKERTLARTDDRGYLEIGLIRFGKYDVLIEGMEDEIRTISVPDAVNCNLPDLLFPIVSSVDLGADFDITQDPAQLHVGQEVNIYPVVWSSPGVPLEGTASNDVRWSSSDPETMAVTVMPDRLILRGMKTGSAQLQAVRYDNSIVRIPNTPIGGVPVSVLVVP